MKLKIGGNNILNFCKFQYFIYTVTIFFQNISLTSTLLRRLYK